MNDYMSTKNRSNLIKNFYLIKHEYETPHHFVNQIRIIHNNQLLVVFRYKMFNFDSISCKFRAIDI